MRRRRSGALIAHVDVESEPEPLDVPARYRKVLLVIHQHGAVIGHAWLPARRRIDAGEQWQAISETVGDVLVRRALRRRVERALHSPDAPALNLRVSVIVCTRDRTEQLVDCLDSLAQLRRPPAEVLVVDNAPSDDRTRELCAGRPVRYVREDLPGQTRARNRGIVCSSGDVVAFTDDDCVVDARWLDDVDEAFGDPLVMAATGYIGPFELEQEGQYLFELHGGFERHEDRRVFDPRILSPVVGASAAGAGANMLLRRAVFEHVGLFAEDLGPGTPARSSDDKYAFYRILSAGFRIRYDPTRIVWHRHRGERQALLRILNDYGVAEFAYTTRLLTEHRDLRALSVWKWWIRHYAGDIRRWARRDPSSVPLALTAAEVRGAVTGPAAWRRSKASRRGIPAIRLDAIHGDVAARRAPASGPAVTAESPSASVAIASYNRRDSLRSVLLKLAEQRIPAERFETVVVLDGSTDGSAAMVHSLDLPYRVRLVEQENRGLAATRNRGASEARNPLVVFLDDDILPEPGWLAEHVGAHADAAPHVVLGAYPPVLRRAGYWDQDVRGWWADHFRRKEQPGHRWAFTDVIDGNLSLPRVLFDELGGFDERFRGGRRQDWEFGMRVLASDVPLSYVAAARGAHMFDPRLATAVRNARQEGEYDALLVDLHPEVAGHLPLARWSRPPRALSARIFLARGVGGEIGLAAAAALEHLRLRDTWRRLVGLLLVTSYMEGLREALGGDQELRELLVDAADGPSEVIDLAGGGATTGGPAAQSLLLSLSGRAFTRVPMIKPGEQWDWLNDPDRIAREAAYPLMVLAADRSLTTPAPETHR